MSNAQQRASGTGTRTTDDGSGEAVDDGPDDAAGEDREPITRRVHENSWSANLEEPRHAEDPDLVVAEAIDAVEATAAGYHVNLVTHADHGHPEDYLWPELSTYDDAAETPSLEWRYVDQCGCGGHVTRVQVS
ncbi:putative rSAM target protein, CGCGG family [Halovivax ruber XH-70]|uniref:Putative rSAM target protein, CGCGG family n=1 Tax=Halovivax ruber (strain DSM 18193 / JCM 13892 / XH-70) TaxID=797302 RepID=L0IFL8_HALRX|nr:CGCGG family rSAM-modified RiPP protein [Halovivax ruber]AGB17559.1 putative rSAM target protein, CGCGG family [Halovivax ruber XH-70]